MKKLNCLLANHSSLFLIAFSIISMLQIQALPAQTVKTVALKAANGQYLCAENGGGIQIFANRNARGPWETFTMEILGNGQIALKAVNGQYLCAENGGGIQIFANRNTRGPWETFTMEDLGSNKIALKAVGGQYVCAENGGGVEIFANRNERGSWETFTIEDLTPVHSPVVLSKDQPSFIFADVEIGLFQSTLWKPENLNQFNMIEVCWENPTPADDMQRRWVRHAIERTWNKAGAIGFSFKDLCTADSKGIRIQISNNANSKSGDSSWPQTNGIGTVLNGKVAGMVLNFSIPGMNTEATISSTAVHEFGHALGFAHEQNRPDCGCKEKKSQGSDGTWLVTPCDINSVMNYCNPAFNGNGILSDFDKQGFKLIYGPGDQILIGDWDGDGKDNLAYRYGGKVYMDTNFDNNHEKSQAYGNGPSEDQYLVGDWDGDGKDNLAVRRGAQVWMDFNFDGLHDKIQTFGNGPSEDQYLVGDWDGDGKDNIAVRRGNQIWMDFNFDGLHDRIQVYGNGSSDEYLVGDWDGDGKDNIAVRRGNQIWMDFNFDGLHDKIVTIGANGTKFLVGDWDGNKISDIGFGKNAQYLLFTTIDPNKIITQYFGLGTRKE